MVTCNDKQMTNKFSVHSFYFEVRSISMLKLNMFFIYFITENCISCMLLNIRYTKTPFAYYSNEV